ncbi:hypothetical protein OSB04_009080 [Centaurea solstitialis]|uniref:Dihydroflavonol 4-reductase n=1 Tax=Centaurea solstitialis TaxID=347529 RepID=A0AA38TZS4_9ASTR|nr:hypothetical protein OSB04_009080 [Centaurea solstitialis]
MIGEGKVVCVTGASGYIASWLVKILLHRGYSVHATVRSLDDPKKTEHLLTLDGAKERLSLFEANLTQEGSFESAVNGCECLFHTASPVAFSVDGTKAQLVDPAVKGTLNVLKSAAKVPSLKRVVLTSSMTAVMHNGRLLEDEVEVNETWFSDPQICEQKKSYNLSNKIQIIVNVATDKVLGIFQLWYALSKTLAEDAATKFSKENGLELVIINPGYVIGPILQPTLNLSSEKFLSFIKTGKEISPFPNGIYRLVDVRDVASAHILAFENPKANGRYCVVGDVIRSSEIMYIINKLYPALHPSESWCFLILLFFYLIIFLLQYAIEKEKVQNLTLLEIQVFILDFFPRNMDRYEAGKSFAPVPFDVSRERAESLGVEFTPIGVSIKGTIDSLKEKKLLTF